MKKIILIAGPSGAGKTTISDYLDKQFNIPRVITHTTRPMRNGEIDGKSYFFETNDSFSKLHFFEHVHYGDYQYGSSRETLEKMWQDHDIVSLIVDIKGVESYLDQLGDQCYFLYVTTATKDELRKRLIERGDSVESVQKRLSGEELNELSYDLEPYAHLLFNDNWADTSNNLAQIVSKIREN